MFWKEKIVKLEKTIKISIVNLISILLFFGNSFGGVVWNRGDPFPTFWLSAPKNEIHRAYLGIGDRETFNIDHIDAQVVIIEILSMYCPYCQKEAPLVNRLFESIEENEQLREKVKMFGIGVGNSSFEVDIFRKRYNIRFPLIPDPDYKVHKIIGEVRTPYFFILSLSGPHRASVIYSKLGGIGDINNFLRIITSTIEGMSKE